MSDTEEVPKQEEAMETDDAKESTPAPVEKAEEAVAPPAEKSPSKSPAKSTAKSPAKSPKKAAEEKQSTPAKKSSPAKSPKTPSPTKTKKKEEIDKEHEEEDEEEEEEVKKGVLDLPLVVEGKRKRESVTRLQVEGPTHTKHKAPVASGSGTALEDIPFILHQLESEKKMDEFRPFYRICFGSVGKQGLLRKELKKFNGFTFAIGSEEYKRKHALIMKLTKADISYIRRILGVPLGKSKEEEVSHVLDFLVKPHDEGRKVPQKAAKRKRSTGKTPKKASKRGESSKKKTTSKETVDTESDEEKSEESGEEEEEEEVKTPKKTPAKRKAAATPKGKTPAKKAKKAADSDDDNDEKEKEDDHSVTSSSDTSSEKKKEEKKTDAQSPTDAEVKAKIAELLKGFDLTTVSMKQMVLAVCDAFPGQTSLSERTANIKTWIKDAIKEDEEEA